MSENVYAPPSKWGFWGIPKLTWDFHTSLKCGTYVPTEGRKTEK